ncbi:hypothetical protein HPB48_010994 [Haemaphysalis longicornis]|uniref:Uncharacterized protein n=1 Tax=Haemaphysalis longicornis TaxID=44386 RepID=A0A9J6FXM6_HAELO|nr:hypothetical protein HPB48_010994 [Haemaphysalis longicornis]
MQLVKRYIRIKEGISVFKTHLDFSRTYVGYVLTITKASRKFNLAEIMAIVKEAAPEAELEDDKQQDVRISLKSLECKKFAPMFEALENSNKKLGAGNIGVTVASMKDVYIKYVT